LIESFKQFEAMVETMVDLSLIDQHEYRIRPDFDDDLKEFYKGIQRSKQKMEDLRNKVTLAQ
jgi:DNA mismatch repair protein MSH2